MDILINIDGLVSELISWLDYDSIIVWSQVCSANRKRINRIEFWCQKARQDFPVTEEQYHKLKHPYPHLRYLQLLMYYGGVARGGQNFISINKYQARALRAGRTDLYEKSLAWQPVPIKILCREYARIGDLSKISELLASGQLKNISDVSYHLMKGALRGGQTQVYKFLVEYFSQEWTWTHHQRPDSFAISHLLEDAVWGGNLDLIKEMDLTDHYTMLDLMGLALRKGHSQVFNYILDRLSKITWKLSHTVRVWTHAITWKPGSSDRTDIQTDVLNNLSIIDALEYKIARCSVQLYPQLWNLIKFNQVSIDSILTAAIKCGNSELFYELIHTPEFTNINYAICELIINYDRIDLFDYLLVKGKIPTNDVSLLENSIKFQNIRMLKRVIATFTKSILNKLISRMPALVRISESINVDMFKILLAHDSNLQWNIIVHQLLNKELCSNPEANSVLQYMFIEQLIYIEDFTAEQQLDIRKKFPNIIFPGKPTWYQRLINRFIRY